MTDNEILSIARCCTLLDHLRMLLAIHPEKVEDYVPLAIANRAVLEFAHALLEAAKKE